MTARLTQAAARWWRRGLTLLAILAAGAVVAYGAIVFVAILLHGNEALPVVTIVTPIPPYPPCPPEANGSAGCLADTASAVEGLPEVRIGRYTVRMDPPREHPYPIKEIGRPPSYVPTMTIWRDGEKIVEECYAEALDPHTGLDVNGDGYPDAIVHIFSWGAHCCFCTVLYSLGPEVVRYRVGRWSECQGEFRDLDGDGVYEYLTCDDTFAYAYCSFPSSPLVRVVLRSVPGVGYRPASPEFPELYAEDIARHTGRAERAVDPRLFGDNLDGMPKCEVLGLVLDYLYSGQIERAWEALYHYYRYPDVDGFRADIEHQVWRSSYFVPPAAPPPGSGQ